MSRTSNGPVITDGKVNYTSPSALSTANPEEYGGCPRRYWWKYVQGKKEPTTAAQTRGSELVHAPIEAYLKTGQKALPPMVMAGAAFIPDPGPDLLVEHAIGGALKVAGIPMIGYIDLLHSRPQYIDSDGDLRSNGNELVYEVVDWKSTGDLSRAKSGADLLQTTQMVSYAEYAFGLGPDSCDAVRLSHVYFRTKGTPKSLKSTVLVRPVDIAPQWKKIEHVGKMILDIAKQTSESGVEANTKSCSAYGGCPHRSYCSAGKPPDLLNRLRTAGGNMGLLDSIKPEVKAEIAALKAAEVKSVLLYSPEFAAAVAAIEAAGKGFPALGGDAAKAYSQLKGRDLQGQGLAGSGMLGALSLNDNAAVLQVATELAEMAKVVVPSADMPGLLPPDAPASQPPAAAVATEAPKAKRGRKAKDDSGPVVDTESTRVPAPVTPIHVAATGLVLFVDCSPGEACTPLDSYIDTLCSVMCEEFKAVDIRCAPTDSPLGFGKWKGVLAAFAKDRPPTDGSYTVDTRGREIAEVVADALRPLCELYVKGIR